MELSLFLPMKKRTRYSSLPLRLLSTHENSQSLMDSLLFEEEKIGGRLLASLDQSLCLLGFLSNTKL